MLVAGYCNCFRCTGKHPGEPGYGITASGRKAARGTAAADPRFLVRGTRIEVAGHSYRVCDTGGAIKGARLDLWFPSHRAALQWGVKTLKVTVNQ
jgi:3D (Asp-Asp-Asp) domain-containing protein